MLCRKTWRSVSDGLLRSAPSWRRKRLNSDGEKSNISDVRDGRAPLQDRKSAGVKAPLTTWPMRGVGIEAVVACADCAAIGTNW